MQAHKQQKQSNSNGNNVRSKSKKTYSTNNNYHATPTTHYNKSSSYPNFSSNSSSGSSTGSINNNQQYINVSGQTPNQPHHSYHRHSISNLITITPSITTPSIVTPTARMTQHHKISNCIGLHSTMVNGTAKSKSPSLTSSTILPQISYCSFDTPVSSIGRSSSTGSSIYSKQTTNKHLLGDISPYRDLESLSLQMTEQAIN